jgi:hypothetical protein
VATFKRQELLKVSIVKPTYEFVAAIVTTGFFEKSGQLVVSDDKKS